VLCSQRVLTHADATAIAAQVPTPTAPGAGGLPQPRTSLEAAFMIADARAKVCSRRIQRIQPGTCLTACVVRAFV
jgi:hypothetical protein